MYANYEFNTAQGLLSNMYIGFIFFTVLLSFIILALSKKFYFLIDVKLEKHKKFTSTQKNYSIGGILLVIFLILNFYNRSEYLNILFFLSVFLIGILSDLKILNNPKIRFLVQTFLIILFIYLLDIRILNTRTEILDNFLENKFFNYFFVIFCLMILINGSNFVDGINTLLISYYIIVLGTLLIFLPEFIYHLVFLKYIITLLLIILAFNLNGKIILGDSGSYSLGLFVGIYLINFSNQNIMVSPFFIILLLWYPCFELLFSMIRRNRSNIAMYEPDIYHLHQLMFNFFKTKILVRRNINHLIISLLINFYNLLIIFLGVNYIYQTSKLVMIIILNLTIYSLVYFFLRKNKKY